jgi:multidrug efflux pump subunit AcrA (membrane-fusion protein)
VYTVKDNKAVEVNVEPGEARAENNTYVEIASGLKGGESVVTTGMSKLATGVPVTIRSATAARTSED